MKNWVKLWHLFPREAIVLMRAYREAFEYPNAQTPDAREWLALWIDRHRLSEAA